MRPIEASSEAGAGTRVFAGTVSDEDDDARLDIFLARNTTEAYSRTYLQNLIREGNVSVDDSVIRIPASRVTKGQRVRMTVPPPKEGMLEPEDIPLDVVYEDDDIIVINKSRDLVVHPAPGHYSGTLVHALLHHSNDLSTIIDHTRPGIVHRLDKDTTGVMVVAKNDTAHLSLSYQLQKRHMKREYLALVHGVPEVETGTVKTRIGRDPETRFKMRVVNSGGKFAVTHFRVDEILGNSHALLRCNLETGRTHQIRVHLTFIGHPVVGDPMYAPSWPDYGLSGQALHAARLTLEHPTTGEEMEFEAPIPDDMDEVIQRLRGER
ncbi:MAG: RluA family pseudouridine synthase [Bacillota bacterium]